MQPKTDLFFFEEAALAPPWQDRRPAVKAARSAPLGLALPAGLGTVKREARLLGVVALIGLQHSPDRLNQNLANTG